MEEMTQGTIDRVIRVVLQRVDDLLLDVLINIGMVNVRKYK
jgi:hypothetical protein